MNHEAYEGKFSWLKIIQLVSLLNLNSQIKVLTSHDPIILFVNWAQILCKIIKTLQDTQSFDINDFSKFTFYE